MELKNFYKYFKICPNAVATLQECILTDCHSIKRHSEFEEYFVLDSSQPSHSQNEQTYNSLVNSLFGGIE